MKLPKMPKMPLPKMPKSVSKVLENQYVLYFVFFLALTNLFGYMILGNIHAIVFFIIAGFVCTFFTKNMIIIMSIPIVLTSVLMVGKQVKESFQDMMDASSPDLAPKSALPDSAVPKSALPDSAVPDSALPTASVQKKIKNIIYPEYETNKENEENVTNEDSMIPLDSAQIPESDA